MDVYLKATACVLVALILWICLSKSGKDYSVLLTLCVCSAVAVASVSFLQPVVSFIREIANVGQLNDGLLSTMLKTVGIGLLAEICMLVCKDAGNESMGKVLQVLSTCVVLWLSIPVFEELLSLLDKILGKV